MREKEAKVLDYRFKDFAHTLHDYARPNDPVDLFTQELFDNIVTDEYEEKVDKLYSKTFGYYYNGRSINELCRKIGNNLNEDKFTEWIDNLELDEEHWNLLYNKLKSIGIKFDKRHKNKSIAKYFKNLIIDRSIIKNSDNVVFKMNIADDYISKVIEQENKKLDSRISKYYEYKRSNNGNNTNIYLKPKSKEIAMNVPIKVVGKFDIENANEEELYNLNHFSELGPLINYNNKPLILPKIKESSKSINGVSISNESIDINEVGSNIILYPSDNLKKVSVNFNIYNGNMNVSLRNVDLTIINYPTKTYFTNNNRNEEYPYDFEMIFNISKDKKEMTYGFNIGLRKKFVFDTRTILKYYIITSLLEDKKSIVKITTPELEKPLYYKENYGKHLFTDIEYKNMNSYIEEIEKIVFLEDTLDVRFKFDINWLRNNIQAVNIAYSAFKHEEIFINGKTSWTLESNKENFNDLAINSIIKFESSISTIELFGEVFEMPETKLFINDAIVEKITINGNKKKLLITAKSLTASSFIDTEDI